MDIAELRRTSLANLRVMAEGLRIDPTAGLRKQELIYRIEHALLATDVALRAEGTLELLGEGFGFLRSPDWNYLAGPDDIYVSQTQIRRFNVKTGDPFEAGCAPQSPGRSTSPCCSSNR